MDFIQIVAINNTFFNCWSLREITSPAGVTSFGDFAFIHCSDVQSIDIESNNLNSASIDEILFTKNLEEILCFPAKHHFSSYQIPANVASIAHFSFCECSNLQSITIPTSVRSIDDSAFFNCRNLQTISIFHLFQSRIPQAFNYQNNFPKFPLIRKY